jgi:SNF family Na+-dependent transporter
VSNVGFALAAMAFVSIVGRDIGTGNTSAILLESAEGLAILIYLSLIVLPGAFAGFGLLFGYDWGKSLAILLGAMSLIFFPIGTIFGIYVIWGLSREEGSEALIAGSGM